MIWRLIGAVLTVAYPFVILWGTKQFGVTFSALFIVLLATIRYFFNRKLIYLLVVGIAVLLAILGWCWESLTPAKLYPVLVNIVMLFIFGSSLLDKENIIEKFAKAHRNNLPQEAIRYTRRVTQVWCGFFVLNGSIATYTALVASDYIWALYNGCIAYILMGALFGLEWIYRTVVLRESN